MNTWIDNLLALLVGGVVVLILVAQQRTAQNLSVDSSVSYMSKSQTLDMASWITEDLTNIGSGVVGVTDVAELPTNNADSLTTRFAFRRRLSSTEATQSGSASDTLNPKRFVYEVSLSSTVTLSGRSVKLYRLKRCVAASGGCAAGDADASPSRLSDFRITLLDRLGAVATDADSVRLLRIRLASVVPLAETRSDTYIPQTYWGTTLPVLQPDNR